MTKTQRSLLIIGGLAASYALVALDTNVGDVKVPANDKTISHPAGGTLHKAIYILPAKQPVHQYHV